jgi:hypothetical protein
MRFIFILCLLIYFHCEFSIAQQTTVKKNEIELQQLFASAASVRTDSERIRIYTEIEQLIGETLKKTEAFSYSFDSLRNIGKIISKDGKVRVFTWNLLLSNASQRYYGYILYKPTSTEPHIVFCLKDSSDISEATLFSKLNKDSWYGALYYDIIEKKWGNTMLYALLGYDPHSLYINRKIIDCIYFKDNNELILGAPVFKIGKNIQYRVLFAYSAKVAMSLKYNENLKMIVFDHLSPSSSSYTGLYQYYGPDFSFDGFKFDDGYWNLFEDIDVRNK